MGKPDSLYNWTIIQNKNTKEKTIWYGTFQEYIKENEISANDCIEIPFDEWTENEFVEIFENEIEDRNYHSWTWLPRQLLNILKENEILSYKRFNILVQMYERWDRGW